VPLLGASCPCQYALREQYTVLHKLTWNDFGSRRGLRDLSLDPVLLALPACPHLRKVAIVTKFASANALKNLLQLHLEEDLYLALEKEHWLAVADEIRHGHCNVQLLTLAMLHGTISGAKVAEKAVASAIRLDLKLEHLTLEVDIDFTDKAGAALAEASTVFMLLGPSTHIIHTCITLASSLHHHNSSSSSSSRALDESPKSKGGPGNKKFRPFYRKSFKW
jgi:hypothetical protein